LDHALSLRASEARFHLPAEGRHVPFQGHGIINRFSEDIDILIEPPPERGVKTGKNQNSPAQIKTRTDFYDWLAQTISIDGISEVGRETARGLDVPGANRRPPDPAAPEMAI
jgi:hypothetical protein